MRVQSLAWFCGLRIWRHHKLAGWNKGATGNKFLNELIFILISPAYAVCGVADVLVLNTIEFWTGSNPVAQRVGTTQEITGKDGKLYAVTTLRNGYKIKSPDGEVIKFKYDKKTNSWSKEEKGKIEELFRINEDGTIQAYLQDGRSITVTPDAAGLYEVRMAAAGACFSPIYSTILLALLPPAVPPASIRSS